VPDPQNNPVEPLPELERAPKPARLIGTVIPLSLIGAILFLLLFSWLAHEVFEGDTARFDSAVRGWVHQFTSPTLTHVMFAISWMGSIGLFFCFLLSIALLLIFHWKRAALWLFLSLAGANLLITTLKNTFQRPRPVAFFGVLPSSYSFPSGHSLASFCFYIVLAGLLSSRVRSTALRIVIWILASLLVTAIGLSRIYLGVHYPSDVIGGYLAAALWVTTLLAADHMRTRRHVAPGAPENN
jgi:undecaprenyl-diphosphatase